ncbi:MAG: hypothetical protein HPY66_2014 [Firmicutes bacterium]|nr:hypothetical protein [Bacillota bacterium]
MRIPVSIGSTFDIFNLVVVTFRKAVGYPVIIIVENARQPVIKGFTECF